MAKILINKLRDIVGEKGVLDSFDFVDRSSVWGTNQPMKALAVVCPKTTEQLSGILSLCNDQDQSVVPIGGMTNLVQGAVTTSDDLAISFEKMNLIECIDNANNTLIAQSGVTLQDAQSYADDHGLYFPIDIGARGNCMLGGNVSTNAGGTRVIRYGMIRESVLGLEAVLADGTIVSSMNTLLKNNSGFDLKQLFIGTEGLLGLITRIVFRLHPKPRSHNVALVACNNYEQVMHLLSYARESFGNSLCGFEVMWDNYFHNVVKPVGRLSSPIEPIYEYYVIIECIGSHQETDDEIFETSLTTMLQEGVVSDGVVAKSDFERDEIWSIRHDVEWLIRDALVFDISLPINNFPEYIRTITEHIKTESNGAKVITFGHLGDNNLHVSVVCEDARSKHMSKIQHAVGFDISKEALEVAEKKCQDFTKWEK